MSEKGQLYIYNSKVGIQDIDISLSLNALKNAPEKGIMVSV